MTKHNFTCGILTNSNFQKNLANSENLLNYFFITGTRIVEILTNVDPVILKINDEEIKTKINDFIHRKNILTKHSSAVNRKINTAKSNSSIHYSEFLNGTLDLGILNFEFMNFSDKGVEFIVREQLSMNYYKIHYASKFAFQCIQFPYHGADYFRINEFLEGCDKAMVPLWKLDSSQLLDESNDLNVFLDKGDFGSLYLKTNNTEIECVSKKPPQITLENRELEKFVQDLSTL